MPLGHVVSLQQTSAQMPRVASHRPLLHWLLAVQACPATRVAADAMQTGTPLICVPPTSCAIGPLRVHEEPAAQSLCEQHGATQTPPKQPPGPVLHWPAVQAWPTALVPVICEVSVH